MPYVLVNESRALYVLRSSPKRYMTSSRVHSESLRDLGDNNLRDVTSLEGLFDGLTELIDL